MKIETNCLNSCSHSSPGTWTYNVSSSSSLQGSDAELSNSCGVLLKNIIIIFLSKGHAHEVYSMISVITHFFLSSSLLLWPHFLSGLTARRKSVSAGGRRSSGWFLLLPLWGKIPEKIWKKKEKIDWTETNRVVIERMRQKREEE